MSLILRFDCCRITVDTMYPQSSGLRYSIKLQTSKSDSQEGRTPFRKFFWNREIFVKDQWWKRWKAWLGYIECYLRFSWNPGAEGGYLITLPISASLVYLVWYTTASATASSLVYLVCRIRSGKWNVTRVTLHEFDISVLLKQDSHCYLYPWPRG